MSKGFISIKAKEANMRLGPSMHHKIKWIYKKRGLPMEILEEFEQWYHVRDSEGEDGWMNKSLLSKKKRSVILKDNNHVKVYKAPQYDAKIVFTADPKIMAKLGKCTEEWCYVELNKKNFGWINKKNLWGVYMYENGKF